MEELKDSQAASNQEAKEYRASAEARMKEMEGILEGMKARVARQAAGTGGGDQSEGSTTSKGGCADEGVNIAVVCALCPPPKPY